tara:strand:+ start:966 stop:1310 length:345 start_codon:yes stop_codon:yes gene_type:complete
MSPDKSILLFFLLCIPARLLLAYLSTRLSKEHLKMFGVILLLISLAFFYLYFTNSRLDAQESSTGKTWWAPYRAIHASLYLVASIYALQGKQLAWIPLVIDVVVGLFLYFFVKK